MQNDPQPLNPQQLHRTKNHTYLIVKKRPRGGFAWDEGGGSFNSAVHLYQRDIEKNYFRLGWRLILGKTLFLFFTILFSKLLSGEGGVVRKPRF